MPIDHERTAVRPPTHALKKIKKRRSRPPGDPQRASWNAADLMRANLPPQSFAVLDMFAVGANLCAGPPKKGKSWLLLDVAYSVAVGRPFFDRQVTQGHVLYLAMEGSARDMQDRLHAVQRDSEVARDMQLERRWPALDDGGLRNLRIYLRGHPTTRLVVIDTLSRVVGNRGRDQYQSEFDRMSNLSQLGHEFDCSIVAVLHDRQAAAKDWTQKVMGTNGYLGAADGISLLKPTNTGKADATLHVTGREFEESEHALELVNDYGWKRLDGPATDYGMSDTRRLILDYLRSRPGGATPKEVTDALQVSSAVARKRLSDMARSGTLSNTNGVYQVPDGEAVTPVTPSHLGSAPTVVGVTV